jgi:hypothetical protein
MTGTQATAVFALAVVVSTWVAVRLVRGGK